MDNSKKGRFVGHVRRFRARFVQSGGSALGEVLTAQILKVWLIEQTGRWRERLYSPLTTVVMFIKQVLGTDHSGQDAVAQGPSSRVALGKVLCSRNTVPYGKARRRLALSLVERLGHEVGARLCAAQAAPWL